MQMCAIIFCFKTFAIYIHNQLYVNSPINHRDRRYKCDWRYTFCTLNISYNLYKWEGLVDN